MFHVLSLYLKNEIILQHWHILVRESLHTTEWTNFFYKTIAGFVELEFLLSDS